MSYYTPNWTPYVTSVNAQTGAIEVSDLPASLTRNETGQVPGGTSLPAIVPFDPLPDPGQGNMFTKAAERWADKILNGGDVLPEGASIPFAPGGGDGGGGGASYTVPQNSPMTSQKTTFPVFPPFGVPAGTPTTTTTYAPAYNSQAAACAAAAQKGAPVLHLTPDGPFDGYYEVLQWDYSTVPGVFSWNRGGNLFLINYHFIGCAAPVAPNPYSYLDEICTSTDTDDLILLAGPCREGWGTADLPLDWKVEAFVYACRDYVPLTPHSHVDERQRLWGRFKYWFVDLPPFTIFEYYYGGFDIRAVSAPPGSGHGHIWRFPFWEKKTPTSGFIPPVVTTVGLIMSFAAAAGGLFELVGPATRQFIKPGTGSSSGGGGASGEFKD